MKIRIKDNSIRYRLAQSEVTELVNLGETWSKCQFPSGELVYGVIATDADEITSTYVNGKVTTKIPRSLLTNWDIDQRVGFDKKTDDLYILIEKDWQCLKPRTHEDESNLYANPGLQTGASE
jgi:ATP adenylyltransferase/5',5'''-P-1,P-4-tetraphosphate phosphorylase II